ncbi:MAG: hypothetical protein JXA33_15360 [Anaerolineae bacterium]|nr:hypothetical protein [Anaerolineae bacterium]
MKNNPYIGPRPYTCQDRDNFYGRNREARDLLAKIMAERVVLFYAQSGAGKSSLLNAKIIPALEEDGFHVLPVARVGSEIPRDLDPGAVQNVFVFSAILTLAGREAIPQALTHYTLASYLQATYPTSEDTHPPLLLLILDQFEELFTAHQDRWHEARDFFLQIRDALETVPGLGVLFTMREDYVAALDPYTALLPRRLRARFRMERLGLEGALEAIVKPALNAGCNYGEGVAERLVDNLRQVKVQQLNGQGELEETYAPGPYVEAVQLQVICYQLWENLPEQDDYAIQWEEIEQYGNIDQALTDFYNSALYATMRKTGTTERRLRQWFGEQLITPMETRGLVLRNVRTTAGLPNEAVDVLERRYLIRAEARGATRWYEICHDRLIEPILTSNRAWDAARETPLRSTARSWQQTGDDALLYHDGTLHKALDWAQTHPDDVEPFVSDFLEASQEAEKVRQQVRRRRSITMTALAAGLLIMTVLTFYAFRQRQLAMISQLAGQAHSAWNNTGIGTLQSLLLATESMKREATLEGQQILIQGVALLPSPIVTIQHEKAATVVIFSPDGQWMASGSEDATIHLWNVLTQQTGPIVRHDGPISEIDFSPDGHWMFTGSGDHTARVWDVWDEAVPEVARIMHTGPVGDVTISPDGQWAASASEDGTVQVLEVGTWRAIARLELAPDEIVEAQVVDFNPDGSRLAVGGTDGNVRVWDIPSGILIAVLEHDDINTWAVRFTNNGRWLVSGGEDKTTRVWDVGSWQEVARYTHQTSVWLLAVSPDGHRVASGLEDGLVQVWDIQSQRVYGEISHAGPINYINFSPDGQWVASASSDGTARVWSAETGRELARGIHENAVWDICFSPDGDWVASASEDSTTKVWAIHERAMAWVEHQGDVWELAFHPNGRWVASGSDDDTVRIWDAATGKVLARVAHKGDLRSLLFSPDGRWGASGDKSGLIQVWEPATGQVLVSMQHDARVRSLAVSADGNYLASGSEDETVRVWDPVNGTELARMHHEGGVKAVAFNPNNALSGNGVQVASGGGDGTARVWDVATQSELLCVSHDDEVWGVTFSPDGRWLASGSNDHTIRIWDLQTGVEIKQISFVGFMEPLTFSPDGQYFAFGGGDFSRWSTGTGDLQVWKTDSWELVYRKQEYGWVRELAFSSDGKWLASAEFDGTVHVLDIAQRTIVAKIKHTPRVYSVAFSPDARWLVSSGMDKTARVWLWNSQDLIDAVCARLPRNLSAQEWRSWVGYVPSRPTCPDLPTPKGGEGAGK